MREIEMTAEVGDYKNGDGAKLFMDNLGIAVQSDVDRTTGTIEWAVWDAIVAEVERYRAAVKAAEAA